MTIMNTQSKMKTYEIAWVKNYYATGRELIEAESEQEALQFAEDNIGDYEGSMEYDPDNPAWVNLGERKLNE